MGYLLKNYLRWDNLKCTVTSCEHDDRHFPFPVHSHADFYELVVVREGNALHRLGEIRVPVSGGSVFLIPPGVEHGYENAHRMRIYNVLFDPSFLDCFRHDLSGTTVYQRLFGVPVPPPRFRFDCRIFPEAVRLLETAEKEAEADRPGGRTAVLAALFNFFLLLCRNCREEEGTELGPEARISDVLAALDDRFHEAWTVGRMAVRAGLGVTAFRRAFRELTGFAPAAYLMRLRIDKAAAMLELSNRGVGDISGACGFADSNYFARCFRALRSVSPRDYRAARRSANGTGKGEMPF